MSNSDGTSLDTYRLMYGLGNDSGDAGHDISRAVQLMQLGWHGNNN